MIKFLGIIVAVLALAYLIQINWSRFFQNKYDKVSSSEIGEISELEEAEIIILRQAEEMVFNIQKIIPKKLDEATTMTNSYIKDKAIVLEYSLDINKDDQSLDEIEKWVEKQTTKFVANTCRAEQINDFQFLNNGWTWEFLYKDIGLYDLVTISVAKSDCNEIKSIWNTPIEPNRK